MNPRTLRTGVVLAMASLIAYGSLFPFRFQSPGVDAGFLLAEFFSRWGSDGRLTDLLGNIALFVPLGLAVGSRGSTDRARAVVLALHLVWVGLFATALQVAQLWLPDRNAALSDVFWNLVGAGAGMAAAQAVSRVKLHIRAHPLVLLLLAGWLLSQTAPLVPALGWQEFKDSLKPLLLHPDFEFGEYLLQTAMALAVAGLLQAVPGRVGSSTRFALVLLAVLGLQMAISHRTVEWTAVAAFLSAWLVWSLWLRHARAVNTVLVIGLVVAFTAYELLPFELAGEVRDFHWLPFAASLRGSVLAAVIHISATLFLFGAVFWFVQQGGGRVAPATVGLALWVWLLEGAQTLLRGHTPDVTPALLVVLAGVAVALLGRADGYRFAHHPPALAASRPVGPPPAGAHLGTGSRRPLLLVGALIVALAVALHVLVGLPGVPYNLRELFLGDGLLFKALLIAAVIWLGVGSGWMARRLSVSPRPWLALPGLLLLVCLVSLLLLSVSVTDESLMDIVGSSNMHWFITQRQIWGAGMAHVLQALDMPRLVGWLERIVRYTALVAPLVLSLALLGAAWLRRAQGRWSTAWWLSLLLAALPWFWLAKAVAFDWSSTDNLNELIARDAAWGLGGGFYLYVLLLLMAANVVLVAAGPGGLGVRALASVLALPVSWWLLQHGLEPAVQKYGQTFSGTQFLLGPDRSQTLSAWSLFGRWATLHLGGVLVLASGFRVPLRWPGARAAGVARTHGTGETRAPDVDVLGARR